MKKISIYLLHCNCKSARTFGRLCVCTKMYKLTKIGTFTHLHTNSHTCRHILTVCTSVTSSFQDQQLCNCTVILALLICWMNKDFFCVVIWIKPILRCINDLFFKFLLSVLSTYMTSTLLKNISMYIICISIQRRIFLIELDILHIESMKL